MNKHQKYDTSNPFFNDPRTYIWASFNKGNHCLGMASRLKREEYCKWLSISTINDSAQNTAQGNSLMEAKAMAVNDLSGKLKDMITQFKI